MKVDCNWKKLKDKFCNFNRHFRGEVGTGEIVGKEEGQKITKAKTFIGKLLCTVLEVFRSNELYLKTKIFYANWSIIAECVLL